MRAGAETGWPMSTLVCGMRLRNAGGRLRDRVSPIIVDSVVVSFWSVETGLKRAKMARWAPAAVLLIFLGCRDSARVNAAPSDAGPSVIAVDSLLLNEVEGLYIGNPATLVAESREDGSFLVADFFEDRILRFDRDGLFRQSYGRPGNGPGEFMDLGVVFFLSDTVVVGVDDQRRLFHLFHRDRGSFLESQSYSGISGMNGYSRVGESVVFPSMEQQALTSVAIWSVPDREIDYVIPLPDEYVRSMTRPDGFVGMFAGFLPYGALTAWPDTIVSGMSGLNHIVVSTWDGTVVDTLDPPAVRRRGVPRDIQTRMDANEIPGGQQGIYEYNSVLMGVHRLSDGSIVLLHHDAALEGELPLGTVTSDIYLSVISPDFDSVCVDGLVPHFKSMRAIHSVERDTLFLLDRRVDEEEGRMDSWIRMYRIDTSDCAWIPLE